MICELTRSLVVDGVRIRWDVTGQGPDLVLVHGNGANFAWWAQVADLLADRYRLTLLDLSGHGDSEHRPAYDPVFWVDEVRAVMAASRVVEPVVVGHSMGGRVALTLAAEHPGLLRGVMLIDTSVRPASRYRNFRLDRRPPGVYATKEAAIARFRLKPEQPHPRAEVMRPLAESAIKRTADGWTWKYDPRALTRFTDEFVDETARRVTVPMSFVYAGNSVVVDEDIARYVSASVPAPVSVTRIDDAHHHVILEQPELCARLIEEFAASLTERPESEAG